MYADDTVIFSKDTKVCNIEYDLNTCRDFKKLNEWMNEW